MKLNQLILAVVGAIFLSNITYAATPKYYRGDLIHSTQRSVRVGGDEVIFGYKVAANCTKDSLKEAAISLKNRATTDRWDDLWYAFQVDSGRCLMIGWYDLNAGRYGWAAAQNQPNSWKVRSNSQGWKTLANDSQAKYSFDINGQKVDLDLFNPNNQGALTGDDILISFGY